MVDFVIDHLDPLKQIGAPRGPACVLSYNHQLAGVKGKNAERREPCELERPHPVNKPEGLSHQQVQRVQLVPMDQSPIQCPPRPASRRSSARVSGGGAASSGRATIGASTPSKSRKRAVSCGAAESGASSASAFTATPRSIGAAPIQSARVEAGGSSHNPGVMPDLEDLWIPLVDEPIGSIVEQIQRDHPEIARLVESPHRILAFRTFAYIRCGLVLGQLLFDSDVPAYDGSSSWVESLMCTPAHSEALARELLAVAEEIAADPTYADDEPLGPDDEARERFLAFAREHLGR